MTAPSLPVFWKDVRSLMKPLAAFLVLQAVWVVGLLLIFWYWERSWPPISALGEVMVLIAIGFGQIFGLVAAGYVFAEEVTAGTDVFLSRLPASRARITAEKLAAGMAVISLLVLIQAAFHLMALPWGGLWSGGVSLIGITQEVMGWMVSPATVAATLLIFGFASYLIGVLISLVTKQALVIVVVGYALEIITYGFFMVGMEDQLFVSWGVAWQALIVYAPLMLVPLLVAMPGSRFRIPGFAALLSPGRRPGAGLVWKSVTENSTLQMLSLVFLLGAWVVPIDVDPSLVTTGALLLLVALGTASYAPVEKEGLDCVLYQHPVPRSHLFWAKIGAALLPIFAVAAGTMAFWSRQTPLDVFTVLAYSGFAYACGVLMTLTFERPVIALLATVSLVITTLLTPLGLIEFMADVADVDITGAGVSVLIRPNAATGGEWSVALLGLTIPAMLLAAGSLWAARRMATNPAVLTGTPGSRLRSFAGLYAVVVAVTFAVTLLSWRQPLALIG